MQRLGVSGAVRPIYGSLGVKRLRNKYIEMHGQQNVKISEYCVVCLSVGRSVVNKSPPMCVWYVPQKEEVSGTLLCSVRDQVR